MHSYLSTLSYCELRIHSTLLTLTLDCTDQQQRGYCHYYYGVKLHWLKSSVVDLLLKLNSNLKTSFTLKAPTQNYIIRSSISGTKLTSVRWKKVKTYGSVWLQPYPVDPSFNFMTAIFQWLLPFSLKMKMVFIHTKVSSCSWIIELPGWRTLSCSRVRALACRALSGFFSRFLVVMFKETAPPQVHLLLLSF